MAPYQDTAATPNKQRKTKLFAVRPSRPCPVCAGTHKCSTGADGLVICGRSKGPVDGFESLGPAKNDPEFFLYRAKATSPARLTSRRARTMKARPSTGDNGPSRISSLGTESDEYRRAPPHLARVPPGTLPPGVLRTPELARGRLGPRVGLLDPPRAGCTGRGHRHQPTIPRRQEADVRPGEARPVLHRPPRPVPLRGSFPGHRTDPDARGLLRRPGPGGAGDPLDRAPLQCGWGRDPPGDPRPAARRPTDPCCRGKRSEGERELARPGRRRRHRDPARPGARPARPLRVPARREGPPRLVPRPGPRGPRRRGLGRHAGATQARAAGGAADQRPAGGRLGGAPPVPRGRAARVSRRGAGPLAARLRRGRGDGDADAARPAGHAGPVGHLGGLRPEGRRRGQGRVTSSRSTSSPRSPCRRPAASRPSSATSRTPSRPTSAT